MGADKTKRQTRSNSGSAKRISEVTLAGCQKERSQPFQPMDRKQAYALVGSEIAKTTGGAVSISDLPDSVILCNGLDDMEGMNKDEAREHAIGVAVEMLEDEGFPFE